MERLIIDRFAGELAVCEAEDGSFISLPRCLLPPNAQEGDCLVLHGEEYIVDEAETARRREENFLLQEELFGE